jgi:hypothetical protein
MSEPSPPKNTEEAAEIVRNDPALRVATDEATDDAATDDAATDDAATDESARTPDTAPTGDDQ